MYSGMVDAAWRIYRGHGLKGLYSGISITLIEIIPYSALQFAAYDFFHQTYDTYKAISPFQSPISHSIQDSMGIKNGRHPLENFFCGLAAGPGRISTFRLHICVLGIVSKLVTHPLDVVKKRYQVAGLQRSLRYGQRISVRNVQTLLLSFRIVIQKEGIKGLWKGCLPNIMKASPLCPSCNFKILFCLGWTCRSCDFGRL